MTDTTPADADQAPTDAKQLHKHESGPGRLLKYRVTFDDGTSEIYDGHAVSQPTTGFVRIHRCFDGVWQLVFAGRAELIRTVRAVTGPEYSAMLAAQTRLNTALDHLEQLIAVAPETCHYDVGDECTTHPNAGLSDEGQCAVPLARRFLNELRPF